MDNRRRPPATLLAAVVTICAGIGVVALGHTDAEPGPGSTPATLGDALSRLEEGDREFRILVIGDSTSADPRGWQQRTMEWLAEETERPWTLHSWLEPDTGAEPGYAAPVNHPGDDDKAPLVMWNASASGRDWEYTAEHIAMMVPEDLEAVDLLMVNHGHNVRPASEYADLGYPIIDGLREQFPEAAVVLFTQNPVRGNAPPNSKETRKYVHQYHATREVEEVSVYKKFQKSGRVEELVDETQTRHPTPKGYQYWFRLLRSRIGDPA